VQVPNSFWGNLFSSPTIGGQKWNGEGQMSREGEIYLWKTSQGGLSEGVFRKIRRISNDDLELAFGERLGLGDSEGGAETKSQQMALLQFKIAGSRHSGGCNQSGFGEQT
jgi:hypothetical protein